MGFLITVFYVIKLFTGVPAFWHFGFSLGLCGTFAPLIANMAGGGATSALRDKEATAWGTLLLALVMIALSLVWVTATGWHIAIFHYDISGPAEVVIGVVIGGLFGLNRKLNPPVPQ